MGAVTAAAATRVWGANEKLNMGIIGLGGRGGSHMSQFPRIANVVAVCDIDQAAREKAVSNLSRNGGEKPKDYEDLRDLLEQGRCRRGLDCNAEPLARAGRHLGHEGRQGRLQRKARMP